MASRIASVSTVHVASGNSSLTLGAATSSDKLSKGRTTTAPPYPSRPRRLKTSSGVKTILSASSSIPPSRNVSVESAAEGTEDEATDEDTAEAEGAPFATLADGACRNSYRRGGAVSAVKAPDAFNVARSKAIHEQNMDDKMKTQKNVFL